jgi:hypothetical protein
MIYRNGNELQARYYGKKAILYIYKGAKIVWQAVSSCFGAGYWINSYPWKNDNPWKN